MFSLMKAMRSSLSTVASSAADSLAAYSSIARSASANPCAYHSARIMSLNFPFVSCAIRAASSSVRTMRR